MTIDEIYNQLLEEIAGNFAFVPDSKLEHEYQSRVTKNLCEALVAISRVKKEQGGKADG